MNLNVLSIHVMLSHSGYWVENDALRGQITGHPVGAALLGEVARVHVRLAGQAERRRQAAREVARLTALLATLDLTHDNMARALHGALDVLILASADPDEVARYERLRGLLFPEGLSIVSRSYMYEAGAITALEARMTADDLAELEAIQIGPQTLADWYRAWVAAGKEIGRNAHAREALLARNGRGGSAVASVDQRSARLDWVNTVQTFLRALDLMQLAPETREHLLSSLEASIAQALRRRGQPADGEQPTDQPGDEPADQPGDEPADQPGNTLPGDALDARPADPLPAHVLPAQPPGSPALPATGRVSGKISSDPDAPLPAPGQAPAPDALAARSPVNDTGEPGRMRETSA